MLSLLEAYLKQARGTLHDVVKIIKEESKRPPPQKQGKKASVSMRISDQPRHESANASALLSGRSFGRS